jgi:16S rRNA G966 N2-methylase RsmD
MDLTPDTFDNLEKETIAKKIKNISIIDIEREMEKLIEIGNKASEISPRCRIGNNIVDYFTFTQRLETKGKYNVSFFEFIQNIDEFKKKKFIRNMLEYYTTTKNKNNTKNEFVVFKEVYNICISAINIIRPLVYMEIYSKYQPACVMDFCAGWGGAAVAACVLDIPKYIGIEINHHLKEPYRNLTEYLGKKKGSKTEIEMIFDDALKVDYTKYKYDLVFTSPPYYFIQKYENNTNYISKKDMDEQFYKPLFTKTYNGLQIGGYYIINVCKEVYDNVLVSLLGEAHDKYPYKKSKRQNEYQEMVYVWKKTAFPLFEKVDPK